MYKLRTILTILKCNYWIVITDKGYNSGAPKIGHKQFWTNAEERFKHLKKNADKLQAEE